MKILLLFLVLVSGFSYAGQRDVLLKCFSQATIAMPPSAYSVHFLEVVQTSGGRVNLEFTKSNYRSFPNDKANVQIEIGENDRIVAVHSTKLEKTYLEVSPVRNRMPLCNIMPAVSCREAVYYDVDGSEYDIRCVDAEQLQ